MLTCVLMGRFANQCYSVATLIAHAKRNNVDYVLPETSGRVGQFPMMFPWLPIRSGTEQFNNVYREPKFGVYRPIPFQDNTILWGYYQCFAYFEDYKEEIIKELKMEPISMFFPGTISIHQRRTDYLKFPHKYPQATDNYYGQAIDFFKQKGYTNFVVFSDDDEYSKEYFKKFEDGKIKMSHANDLVTNSPKMQLCTMAGADHNIIVNSTFSLFASWLNRNPNKIVISPHENNWFGQAYEDRLSTRDMIPIEYTRIEY